MPRKRKSGLNHFVVVGGWSHHARLSLPFPAIEGHLVGQRSPSDGPMLAVLAAVFHAWRSDLHGCAMRAASPADGDLIRRRRPHSGRPRPQLPTSPDNLSAHRPPFAHSHTLPLLTLSYIALGVAHAPRHHNLTRRPWPAATIGRDTHHADDARTACVHPRRRLLRGRKLHVAEWVGGGLSSLCRRL